MSQELMPSADAVTRATFGKLAQKRMEIEDQFRPAFESIANSEGIVRMKFVESEAPYMEGSIAGLYVNEALKMFSHERAGPCDADGNFLPLKKNSPRSEAPTASYDVEIPDSWSELHHLQRIRLANSINGTDTKMTVVEADAIIQTEIERRTKE